MPREPRVGDLELSQDLVFQRREWIAQRVGWGVLLLVLLAALAGLLGKGPLSSTVQSSRDGHVTLEYQRYLRYRDSSTLRILVRAEAIAGEELDIRLNQAWLDGVQIERIMPEPVREEAGSGEQRFVFSAEDVSDSTWIVFHFKPDTIGSLPGTLGIGQAAPVGYAQFVYP